MTVFELFEKKKSKAIHELSRQFNSIYIIKHDIITLFFDSHEFELKITRKKNTLQEIMVQTMDAKQCKPEQGLKQPKI